MRSRKSFSQAALKFAVVIGLFNLLGGSLTPRKASGQRPDAQIEPVTPRKHMHDPAIREMCEKWVDGRVLLPGESEEFKHQMRGSWISLCAARESDALDVLIRKPVPDGITKRCFSQATYYTEINECVDRALAALPRGSINGTFALQKGFEQRIFWTFEDCSTARAEGGGICVSW